MSTTPKVRTAVLLQRFERFKKAYPKKKNWGYAKKVWLKIKPSEELLKKMLKNIEEGKKSKDWQDKRFISYPASYLNAEGWDNEYEPIKRYNEINHDDRPKPVKRMYNKDGSPMSMRQIIEASGDPKALKIYDELQEKKQRKDKNIKKTNK